MKCGLTLLFLLFNLSLFAGDIRGGDIHLAQYTAFSVQANININVISHAEIDQITICWGDGSCDVLGTPQVSHSPAIDTKTLHFFWTHQYDEHGFYEITIEECCWANDIFNMNLVGPQPIVLAVWFKLADPQTEAYNVMPFTPALPVISGNVDEYLVYNSFVNIPIGDDAAFEICEVAIEHYYLLEEIFSGTNNFLPDPLTGGFIWFDPPAPGFFIIKICITASRNGQLLSESSRDILVAIGDAVSTAPVLLPQNVQPKFYPNPVGAVVHLEYLLTEKTEVQLALFDVSGKKMKTFHLTGAEGVNQEILDVRDLPKGYYICKLSTQSQSSFFPFTFIKK